MPISRRPLQFIMNVITKKLPQSKIEITVTLPWEEWKKHEEHAVAHMAEQVNLPGFRKGKVPKNVLEGRFGREAILVETAEDAVQHAFPKAIVDAKAEAIGRPEIKLDSVKENESLTFIIVTAVLPEIILKDWKKDIQKVNKLHKDKKIEVPEEEITKELERLAHMRAKFVTVNRPAQKDDSVEIDFTVLQDGVPIEGGVGKKHPLVIGSGAFIPGFEEALIGMQANEEKKVELEFPVEYHAKNLAGKKALFEVKMLLVQERELPVIDDAFVKGLGRFDTVEALKENLRKGIREEKEHEAKEARRTAILDNLIAAADMEYPEILIQEEEKQMLRQFQTQVEGMGFAWEDYLKQMKKTEAELEKEWEPQAKKRIAAELVLQKLAADEDLAIANEEVEAEMNKVLQHYKDIKNLEKELDLERLYTSIRGRLLNEKVLVWLESL
ncbi:MAG: trigger factor [Candidatus Moraniibacteriota bacterium]